MSLLYDVKSKARSLPEEIHIDDLGPKKDRFYDNDILWWALEDSWNREDNRGLRRILSADPNTPLAPEVLASLATKQFAIDTDHVVRTLPAIAHNANPVGVRNWMEHMYDNYAEGQLEDNQG